MFRKIKFYIAVIFVISILSICVTSFAAPIYPAPVEFTQPNGDVITVTPYGDEFFSWKEDENGNVITYDEESNSYKYAEIKDNEIVPTSQTVGELSLFSIFSHKIQREDIMPLWENAERIDYSKPNDSDGIQLMSLEEMQETDGIKKLLTVLIEFEDVKIKRDGEYWYKHMYSTNPHDISVVNYWKENAEGRDVFEPSDTSSFRRPFGSS